MPYVCGGEINQPRPGFNTAFHTLIEGPDPDMSLVAVFNQGESEEELRDGAESSVRLYAENANT